VNTFCKLRKIHTEIFSSPILQHEARFKNKHPLWLCLVDKGDLTDLQGR
jgi:hypothetical protein